MLPVAGGVSLFFGVVDPFASVVFSSLAPRRAVPDRKVVRAVPRVAAAVRNRRLFIVLVLVDGILIGVFRLKRSLGCNVEVTLFGPSSFPIMQAEAAPILAWRDTEPALEGAAK